MTQKEAWQDLISALLPIYGEQETRSVARIVFEDKFGVKMPSLQPFSPQEMAAFQTIFQRLSTGEPVQYVLEQTDFFGLKFLVNSHVLIPRQETEELVDWVLKTVENQPFVKSIFDIGTGSGCIPITLKYKKPSLEILAIDVSVEALEVARQNAAINQTEIAFQQMDFLNEATWKELGIFDVVVSNPPYIPKNEMTLVPDFVKKFEPHLALFVESETPLVFYEKIADFCAGHLNLSGFLFLECNEFHSKEVERHLQQKGFTEVVLRKDLSGKNRIIRAQK